MNILKAITSKDYYDFVRAIGESKSKQEEDEIMEKHIIELKAAFNSSQNDFMTHKEHLMKLLYVEMLGHDASFGYFHAIKLCAAPKIIPKKVGYLLSGICLDPEHDLRLMLVNQLQLDLKSPNILEVLAALSALCNLLTADMIPVMYAPIIALLTHESSQVRKRAIVAVHRLLQVSPSIIEDYPIIIDQIVGYLTLNDISLINPVLTVINEALKSTESSVSFEQRTTIFNEVTRVLKKIAEHNVPNNYVYHKVPAPFIQIKLLRTLSLLAKEQDDLDVSQANQVVSEVLRRNQPVMTSMSLAVIFQAVDCISQLNLEIMVVSDVMALYLQHPSNNFKCVGIQALTYIVRNDVSLASKYENIVIECLLSSDQSLKRRTLTLLCQITNKDNVNFIFDRLMQVLSEEDDTFFKNSLIAQIFRLIEQHAISEEWYLNKYFTTLRTPAFCSNNVTISSEVITEFYLWIKTVGSASSELSDLALTQSMKLFKKSQEVYSEYLILVSVYCFGEFFDSSVSENKQKLSDFLEFVAKHTSSTEVSRLASLSFLKLLTRNNLDSDNMSSELSKQINKFLKTGLYSTDYILQSRCHMIQVALEDEQDKDASLNTTDSANFETTLEEYFKLVEDKKTFLKSDDVEIFVEEIEDDKQVVKVQDRSNELIFEAYDKPTVGSGYDDSFQRQSFTPNGQIQAEQKVQAQFNNSIRNDIPTRISRQNSALSQSRSSGLWGAEGYKKISEPELANVSSNVVDDIFSKMTTNKQNEVNQGPKHQSNGQSIKDPRVPKAAETSFSRSTLAKGLFGESSNDNSNRKSNGLVAKAEVNLLDLAFDVDQPSKQKDIDDKPINIKEVVLKPCVVPLDEVGERWSKLTAEKRVSISGSIEFDKILKMITDKLNMAAVKVLKESKEVIFVATVNEPSNADVDDFLFSDLEEKELGNIFLHIQLRQDSSYVIIRSTDSEWNDFLDVKLQNLFR